MSRLIYIYALSSGGLHCGHNSFQTSLPSFAKKSVYLDQRTRHVLNFFQNSIPIWKTVYPDQLASTEAHTFLKLSKC